MPAFLAKMHEANQNIICTAKAETVKKVSVEFLLQQRLKIPIFQRRYCWEEEQWETLLSDINLVVTEKKQLHQLGRITCAIEEGGQQRAIVIDGQQRNTTCSLLLAAVRDIATTRSNEATCKQLVESLDNVLFPGGDLQAWVGQRVEDAQSNVVLQEGELLDFAALVPTYCDRASFFSAILPPGVKAVTCSANWQRPMEAKTYFTQKLQDCDTQHLSAVVDVVLHKLEWLFFPLSLTGTYHDGTEDIQVIFERLAVRDATWCKPTRKSEYANMGSADFVRNLLLGSYDREEDAIEMYKNHWLPIEQAAAAAADRRHDSAVATFLENMLESFLQERSDVMQTGPILGSCVVGGQLYPRFRKWLAAEIAKTGSGDAETASADRVQSKTTDLLQVLQGFALEYFERPQSSAPVISSKPKGYLLGVGNSSSWRCTRCSFKNQTSICTACLMVKPPAQR